MVVGLTQRSRPLSYVGLKGTEAALQFCPTTGDTTRLMRSASIQQRLKLHVQKVQLLE